MNVGPEILRMVGVEDFPTTLKSIFFAGSVLKKSEFCWENNFLGSYPFPGN